MKRNQVKVPDYARFEDALMRHLEQMEKDGRTSFPGVKHGRSLA